MIAIHVRNATIGDVDQIIKLEGKTWPSHLLVSKETIEKRINTFSEGQFVLADENSNIFGILFTQRVKDLQSLQTCTYAELPQIFDPLGSHLQLISIAVDTDVCPTGSNILREHAKSFAGADFSIRSIVAITRCQKYVTSARDTLNSSSYEQYVSSLKDPTIFFHTSGGAKILDLIPNYRPEDIDNLGNGVLIEYSLKTSSALSVQEIANYVRMMKSLEDSIEIDAVPLMNLLDSLELMHFHHWLESQLREKLPVDFLFRHSTILQIERAFSDQIANVAKPNHAEITVPSNESIQISTHEEIAIVGIGLKFPGNVSNLPELTQLLETGRYCTTNSLSSERSFAFQQMLQQTPATHEGSKEDYSSFLQYGGYLTSVEEFDFEFFGISRSEAQAMDPNQRLLLECCAKAIYDSGRRLSDVEGKNIGVWVGLSNTDYALASNEIGFRDLSSVYGATGGAPSMTAGRISFLFGIHGPSMVIDTACSSSLVALHQACAALRAEECSEAIVAASNLILSPWVTLAYAKAGMLSPEGKCKTFDSCADGYVRGEGVCAVILKPLSKALEAGDQVYGVIAGSAVMHHGRSPSLTSPNVAAQEQLLRSALKNAHKTVQEVDFLEAHGTGTKLGDPIELAAIQNVYTSPPIITEENRSRHSPLFINSIKANIGHLEATAGLAGVLAALIAFERKSLPKNAHLVQLNPKIQTSQRIVFPQENILLSSASGTAEGEKKKPLVAGISSFGYSGTIAHVIVQQLPKNSSASSSRLVSLDTFAQEYHPLRCSYLPVGSRPATILTTPQIHSELSLDLRERYSLNTFQDHQIHHDWILPGAAMIELFHHFHSVSSSSSDNCGWKIFHDFIIYQPCLIPNDIMTSSFSSSSSLPIRLQREGDGTCKLYQQFSSTFNDCDSNASSMLLASLSIDQETAVSHNSVEEEEMMSGIRGFYEDLLGNIATSSNALDVKELYVTYERAGLVFGESYRLLSSLRVNSSRTAFEALLHPLLDISGNLVQLIDTCIHATGCLLYSFQKTGKVEGIEAALFVPFAIESIAICSGSDSSNIFSEEELGFSGRFQLLGTIVQREKQSVTFDVLLVWQPQSGEEEEEQQQQKKKKRQIIPIFLMRGLTMRQYHSSSTSSAVISASDAIASPATNPRPTVKETEGPAFLHFSEDSWETIETFASDEDRSEDDHNIVGSNNQARYRSSLSSSSSAAIHLLSWPKVHSPWKKAIASSLECDRQLRSLLGPVVVLDSSNEEVARQQSQYSETIVLLFDDLSSSSSTEAERGAVLIKTFVPFLTTLIANYQRLKRIWFLFPKKEDDSTSGFDVFAPLVGLILSARLEYFEISMKMLHLSTSSSLSFAGVPSLVWQKILSSTEIEFTLSRDSRSHNLLLQRKQCSQVLQTIPIQQRGSDWRYTLQEGRGSIESLQLTPSPSFSSELLFQPSEEEEDWVIVQIHFVGLNFRDVLNVLDLYPGDPGLPGCEFSGIIEACSNPKHRETFPIGSRVIGFASDCLTTRKKLSIHQIFPLPSAIPLAIGGMIPVVYATIELALMQLAQMTSEDVVLIHAAAGGIGLAAIQFAQMIGATVIATTSSEKKRDFLRERYQIAHIASSRNAQQFQQELQGILQRLHKPKNGVTIVLNSLSEEFIRSSVEAMAAGGRFLELGKRGIWTRDAMKQIRPDLQYYPIAIDELAIEQPETYQQILLKTCERLVSFQHQKPQEEKEEEETTTQAVIGKRMVPYQALDFFTQTKAAFYQLRSGQTIGKLLLSIPPPPSVPVDPITERGVFIISGGTGGLGLFTAEYLLLERRVERVILLSRSGQFPATLQERGQQLLDACSSNRLLLKRVDVSDSQEVEQFFRSLPPHLPVIGIIHAAGVIEDALLSNQTRSTAGLETIWRGKVQGAWTLHEVAQRYCSSSSLRYFVLFSSIVAAIGREGQAIYAAANRAIDALATLRREQGRVVTSLRLPAISDLGMAAMKEEIRLEDWSIASDRLRVLFDQKVFNRNNTNTSSYSGSSCNAAVLNVFPSTLSRILDSAIQSQFPPCLEDILSSITTTTTTSPVIRRLVVFSSNTTATTNNKTNNDSNSHNSHNSMTAAAITAIAATSGAEIWSEKNLDQAISSLCEDFFPLSLAQSLTASSNLIEAGLDSLAATDFAHRLSRLSEMKLPATFLFNYPTRAAMVSRLISMRRERSTTTTRNNTNSNGNNSHSISNGSPATLSETEEEDDDEEEDHNNNDKTLSTTTRKKEIQAKTAPALPEIAIIGLSLALPGDIYDLSSFQSLLHEKKTVLLPSLPPSSSSRLSARQASLETYSTLLASKPQLSKMISAGGYLSESYLQDFPHKSLEMTPFEAKKLDARQKLALKLTLQALQESGLEMTQWKEKTIGVFAACLGQLKNFSFSSHPQTTTTTPNPSVLDATANALSVVAGRISFVFGFEGPCLTIDTACSSSLVAVHTARRSLQHQECDLAVVVGINYLDLDLSLPFALAGMLSPEAHCASFDAAASGYCRSEGGGCLLLERVSDSLLYREKGQSRAIHALLRGSALFQDGKSASLTAPNGLAQEKLLRRALEDARLEAKELDGIEAHGTGTRLGDPIEIEAILKVFGHSSAAPSSPLYVSSVKGNVGHLEAAAGMIGIFAAILALKTQSIAPNAQLKRLNPEIEKLLQLEEEEEENGGRRRRLEFPTETKRAERGLRHLGVSSFGYSGSLAHCILSRFDQE